MAPQPRRRRKEEPGEQKPWWAKTTPGGGAVLNCLLFRRPDLGMIHEKNLNIHRYVYVWISPQLHSSSSDGPRFSVQEVAF